MKPLSKQEMIDFIKKEYPFDPYEKDVNKFNIEAAIYWFAHNYHDGQRSVLYSVLSTSCFNLSPLHDNIYDEDETVKDMYMSLVKKYFGDDWILFSDYEIIDHGVNNPQYFQGCGTSFTEYDEVFTGIGISAKEALEDALDQAAMNKWCVEIIKNELSDFPDADGCEHCESCSDCEDNCGESNYHYVSLRLKKEE